MPSPLLYHFLLIMHNNMQTVVPTVIKIPYITINNICRYLEILICVIPNSLQVNSLFCKCSKTTESAVLRNYLGAELALLVT